MSDGLIPDGFKLFCADGSFNDAIAPVYLKVDDRSPIMGMRVAKQHCNFVGICHGGSLMTFMDIALAAAVCGELGKYTNTPTVSISFDFMAAAKEGDWLYGDIQSVKLTRTMAFVSAMIMGPNGSVARASACFKLPRDIDAEPGMDADEYHQWRTQTPE
jgi:uncharacterized protein (TIGR00369 family)